MLLVDRFQMGLQIWRLLIRRNRFPVSSGRSDGLARIEMLGAVRISYAD